MTKGRFCCSLAIAVIAFAPTTAPISGQTAPGPGVITTQPSPAVEIRVEPEKDGKLVYLPLAAKTTSDPERVQISLKLRIRNLEDFGIALDRVRVEFSPPPFVAATVYSAETVANEDLLPFSVNANSSRWINFSRHENIRFTLPAPAAIILRLFFVNFPQAVTVTRPLAPHANPVSKGSYLFPARAVDLEPGEYWAGSSGHPGSDQRFAYDMGVAGPDGKGGWSGRYPGTDGQSNFDYRIWNKPIYAMADGVVLACKSGQYDNSLAEFEGPALQAGPTPGGGGNSFKIQHGDEVALYAHMRHGSINQALCFPGAEVEEGDYLGRAGNSGSSSHPHLHVHVVEGNHLRPLLFRGIQIVERAEVDPGEFGGPWVQVDGGGLIAEKSLIFPSSRPPRPIRDLAARMIERVGFGGPDDFTSCPGIPPGGFPNVTNQRYYYLSEVGGCQNLACFLNEVNESPHAFGTLVIDQQCILRQPLRLPSRFTLAGVGMGGESQLVFTGLPDQSSALQVDDAVAGGGNSESTLRDLAIFGDFADGSNTVVGLNVSGGNIVRVSNVRISGFSLGLYGNNAFSVLVDKSNISANGINVAVDDEANSWRLRDSVLSQAKTWSVYIKGPANDHLIAGNRFEGSAEGAVRLESYGAMIMNNRFESNGGVGVLVPPSGDGSRIIGNIFSTDTIIDLGADTLCLGSIYLGEPPVCEQP